MSDKDDDNYEYLKKAIVGAYTAAEEAEEKAENEPKAGEAPNAACATSKLEISVGTDVRWRKEVGKRMENDGVEPTTWKERYRRIEGVRALMKSFHPSFSTTNFLNKDEVVALASLMGLITSSMGNMNGNRPVRALRFRTWGEFEEGVENGVEITREDIEDAADKWSEGMNNPGRGYWMRLCNFLQWEGTFGSARQQLQNSNLDEFGYLWMNNGRDCLVVREDCIDKLDGFTREDVPTLNTMMQWNQFEMSDMYYELCAKAKRNNSEFSMTLRQLKDIEDSEDKEAYQSVIDGL
jgi:hypothetical protein